MHWLADLHLRLRQRAQPAGIRLTYSSYLSGNGDDEASGMAIDTNGDVFVTGTTTSNDSPSQTDVFPRATCPCRTRPYPKRVIQFFVTKVNTNAPGAGGIAYSTYFGGAAVPARHGCHGRRHRSRLNRKHLFQRHDEFLQQRLGPVRQQQSEFRLSHPQRVSAVPGYASADSPLESKSVYGASHAVSDRCFRRQTKSQQCSDGCCSAAFLDLPRRRRYGYKHRRCD